MRIILSKDYSATIDKVFSLFTDIKSLEDRITDIKKITILEGEDPAKLGTKWEETREVFGREDKETLWVTEIVSNKTFVVEAFSRGTKYITTHEFTEEGGKTNVRITFVAEPKSLMAKVFYPFAFLMKGSVKSMLQKDMEELENSII